MVRVCDAIMGSGKSEATITYLREHPNDRIVYVTPYLDEAKRIACACPGMGLVEPSNKIREYDFKKTSHAAALIKEGRSIATTHQGFKYYTAEMLDDIREYGYTLFVDEDIDNLDDFKIHRDDLALAVDSGRVTCSDGIYSFSSGTYHGSALREFFSMIRSRDLAEVVQNGGEVLFYWNMSPDLITSFKDVYIMTYLFKGQSLYNMFQMHDIPFTYIGVVKDGRGTYRFCDAPAAPPEYVYWLKEKIHIFDNGRMNGIGAERTDLSKTWFDKNPNDVVRLQKNISNYFNNVCRTIPSRRNLWSTYKKYRTALSGKGYSRSFLNFNARATNNYRQCDRLVYAVNIYMNVGQKTFYKNNGVDVDEDIYALSTMVQWIWRSAIRDGNEIYLYLPSERMRSMLTGWMDTVREGGIACA